MQLRTRGGMPYISYVFRDYVQVRGGSFATSPLGPLSIYENHKISYKDSENNVKR